MRDTFRSDCPIASALDLLGDKWSLLIVRNAMLGARSFGDFLAAPEGIATNVLSERLERLQACGVLEAVEARAGRRARGSYRLTMAGAELLPVLQAVARWGEDHLPERRTTPAWFMAATPEDVFPNRRETAPG